MLGAIAGDIIGSVFERRRDQIKTTDFPLFCQRSHFTDDTVLTVAVAAAILTQHPYAMVIKDFGLDYPGRGYGRMFSQWLHASISTPYYSWGNGAAMRATPIGFALNTIDGVLLEAQRSAEGTHNHPEGIKGAQAVALAVYMARNGARKKDIRQEITGRFGYDLTYTVADIRPTYSFDVSCQGTVPPAIVAFLDSDDYESTVRLAVSLGGDSDTLACIAGGIAQAYYREMPSYIVAETLFRLPQRFVTILDLFQRRYKINTSPA